MNTRWFLSINKLNIKCKIVPWNQVDAKRTWSEILRPKYANPVIRVVRCFRSRDLSLIAKRITDRPLSLIQEKHHPHYLTFDPWSPTTHEPYSRAWLVCGICTTSQWSQHREKSRRRASTKKNDGCRPEEKGPGCFSICLIWCFE